MDMEILVMKMEENIMELGRVVKRTVLVNSLGLMDKFIGGIGLMIIEMEKELKLMEMAINLMEPLKREIRMVKESSHLQMAEKKIKCGKTELKRLEDAC